MRMRHSHSVLVLSALLFVACVPVQPGEEIANINDENTEIPALVDVATLPAMNANFSLSPTDGIYSVGEIFNVDIVLDTLGNAVNAVDVVLGYDPTMLRVVDADDLVDGVQLTTTDAFGAYPLNSVEGSEILLGGAAVPEEYIGAGIVATITFEALAPGTAQVWFAYEPGSTVDTDVLESTSATDILSSVNDATFTIL